MKIDVFAHILPDKYLSELKGKGLEFSEAKNVANTRLDVRLRLMNRYPDVLQVLTLSLSPLEALVPPSDAIRIAKIANDELSELVTKYPDKFVGAVACLPLNNMDAALEEADRAIKQLDLKGVQIFTNINGETLDKPKFRPLYKKMADYDLPIWIHPWVADRRLSTVFSFDEETSAAMLQLVSSGVFEDYPNIKFITHHAGGIIPMLEGRIRFLLPVVFREGHAIHTVEHLRKFYGDTAVSGSTSALMCGYDFFGADHLLFGTDSPLGRGLTMETIHSIERMSISDDEKERIFEQNAIRLLRLTT